MKVVFIHQSYTVVVEQPHEEEYPAVLELYAEEVAENEWKQVVEVDWRKFG
jgi:hypothetical protein